MVTTTEKPVSLLLAESMKMWYCVNVHCSQHNMHFTGQNVVMLANLHGTLVSKAPTRYLVMVHYLAVIKLHSMWLTCVCSYHYISIRPEIGFRKEILQHQGHVLCSAIRWISCCNKTFYTTTRKPTGSYCLIKSIIFTSSYYILFKVLLGFWENVFC